MTVNSTNLIQGPATLYYAPFGTTEPATIATAPASPWVDLGGTSGGATLNINDTYSVLSVDQIVAEVERRRTNRVVTIATSLAEATLENLARAVNNTAPASDVLELDDGPAAFNPEYGAILLDGIAPGGFRRRAILRKVLATEAVGTAYQKAGQTLIPVTFTGHWVSASIRMLKVTDATA
jgi:hypothetical protein